jgi:hypothetical protein
MRIPAGSLAASTFQESSVHGIWWDILLAVEIADRVVCGRLNSP